MGVLFTPDKNVSPNSKPDLPTILKNEHYQSGPRQGKLVFSPLVGISFLLFILIYMPCVAVIATVKKESGSVKWSLFLISYTTVLAWIVSFIVFQAGSLIF
jgi:ferrous iron transport protein B